MKEWIGERRGEEREKMHALKIVFSPHLVVVCIIAQLLELDQYARITWLRRLGLYCYTCALRCTAKIMLGWVAHLPQSCCDISS